jgi:dTDP-4-dehydrorhamnose reductase
MDITDGPALETLVRDVSPEVIVNCVAVTSHEACESQPGYAYVVNTRAPALLANLATDVGARLVQISSDHYFSGDGPQVHDESCPVKLLNEYARTKYAGERLALIARSSLVIRTNIVGLRRWPDRPAFAEWAIDVLTHNRPLTLFEDFFTSSMHARACAKAILDLVSCEATGLVNVASSEVSSKGTFIRALADELNAELGQADVGTVTELRPRRAESLGLDVTLVEGLLKRTMPSLADTVAAIAREYRDPSPS